MSLPEKYYRWQSLKKNKKWTVEEIAHQWQVQPKTVQQGLRRVSTEIQQRKEVQTEVSGSIGTCGRCGKAILSHQKHFKKGGVPFRHQSHYNSDGEAMTRPRLSGFEGTYRNYKPNLTELDTWTDRRTW